jgi:mitogen-activated protein kinase kinase
MVAHNRSSEVIPSLYPLSSPPMSDSLSAPPRPSVFPTPSRNPPGPPSSRSVATLLASRGNGATPIPASLQEKMAAVCTLPISVPSSLDTSFLFFQMVKRVPQASDVDAATAAFKRISLGAPPTQLRTPSGGAPHRHGPVFPSGMAARRNKPLFKLSDITGEAASAGPVEVVPDDPASLSHRSAAATDTPFANFGKIVYAPPSPTLLRIPLTSR